MSQRKIAFRAWDSEARKMYLLSEIQFANNPEHINTYGHADNFKLLSGDLLWLGSSRDCDLMQFTGLTDKNGKEIYEGDIVLCTQSYGNTDRIDEVVCSVVIEQDGRAVLSEKMVNGDYYDPYAIPENSGGSNVEVIGNIHENPELLEMSRNEQLDAAPKESEMTRTKTAAEQVNELRVALGDFLFEVFKATGIVRLVKRSKYLRLRPWAEWRDKL